MQINGAPTIQSITHVGKVRRDTLDIALLESMAKGDQAALRVLFARHNARVYRFALRLTGNGSIAEETVTDVFLVVWRHADRFQAKCQVSTWLLAIARNKALSKLRGHAELQQCDDAVPLAIEEHADNPEESLEKQDRSAVLRSCVNKLSPEHQKVIDLFYYREKTVDEVAEILGIPPSTVKTRMHYARSRMTTLLERAGIQGLRT